MTHPFTNSAASQEILQLKVKRRTGMPTDIVQIGLYFVKNINQNIRPCLIQMSTSESAGGISMGVSGVSLIIGTRSVAKSTVS